ncbi:DUF4920 domain-containing protein [Salinimicrobium sp. MT39]|uniref:DUF4920 domain-containing protein n=1 Tax=Salinimicrobium profundisediminis TaxID=2994553 RepID=A0A9X3CZ70_9FLAO|nr:DUF4920 domain-containing protein [Salinimicrobium profundisediminis]MCX2839369.1 DUF4920 domain-containing protein [Salinimicrobium profundisediminis]
MKKINLLLLLSSLMMTISCFAQDKKLGEAGGYVSVGEEFELVSALSAQRMQEHYNTLKPGDTVNVAFRGNVASVCKSKGCWMKVALEDDREVMVKFKDYAFFVPKDIEDKEVIVQGKAFVTEISVEDRQHYAEDAGKTPAEVKAITTPELTLSFVADGVKIKN